MKAPRWALGKASPEGLHGSPSVVNQLRTGADQRLTRADDGQVSLGVLTPVFEWVEQLLGSKRAKRARFSASISSVLRLLE